MAWPKACNFLLSSSSEGRAGYIPDFEFADCCSNRDTAVVVHYPIFSNSFGSASHYHAWQQLTHVLTVLNCAVQ